MFPVKGGAMPINFNFGFSPQVRVPGPLEVAVRSNDISSVKSLLENDSLKDVDLISISNATPLIVTAAELGYEEVVDLLIDSKCQLPGKSREQALGEALTLAARGGHGEMVRSLCIALGGVDQRGVKGSTALLTAVESGNLLLVNALLFYGADINTINGYGETPLTLAVRHQNAEIVQALLANDARLGQGEVGLDLDAVGFGALTALELAVFLLSLAENGVSMSKNSLESQARRDAAQEIVDALRFSGATEVPDNVAQIMSQAYWRKDKGPDAATTRLLNEMKSLLEPRDYVLAGPLIPIEEKIRRRNYEFIKAMQTQNLENMENSYILF